MATKIRDIMSLAPVSLAADESVSTAAQAMKEHGIGTVLVVTGSKLSGLVTDRDITIRVLAENRDPLTTRVGDICSTELAVLGPDDDVDQAAGLVRERAVRRIAIVENGIPVGVVSIGDLALEQDRWSALSDISAAPPNVWRHGKHVRQIRPDRKELPDRYGRPSAEEAGLRLAGPASAPRRPPAERHAMPGRALPMPE